MMDKKIQDAMQEYLPKIQAELKTRLGSNVTEVIKDDVKMAKILKIVYGATIQFPATDLLKEDIFIQFCLDNRPLLFPDVDFSNPDVQSESESPAELQKENLSDPLIHKENSYESMEDKWEWYHTILMLIASALLWYEGISPLLKFKGIDILLDEVKLMALLGVNSFGIFPDALSCAVIYLLLAFKRVGASSALIITISGLLLTNAILNLSLQAIFPALSVSAGWLSIVAALIAAGTAYWSNKWSLDPITDSDKEIVKYHFDKWYLNVLEFLFKMPYYFFSFASLASFTQEKPWLRLTVQTALFIAIAKLSAVLYPVLFITLATIVIWVAVVIIIIIAVVLLIWIFFGRNKSDEKPTYTIRRVTRARGLFNTEEVDEIRDEDGNIVGENVHKERHKNIFEKEKYIEHRDKDGNIIGKTIKK